MGDHWQPLLGPAGKCGFIMRSKLPAAPRRLLRQIGSLTDFLPETTSSGFSHGIQMNGRSDVSNED